MNEFIRENFIPPLTPLSFFFVESKSLIRFKTSRCVYTVTYCRIRLAITARK